MRASFGRRWAGSEVENGAENEPRGADAEADGRDGARGLGVVELPLKVGGALVLVGVGLANRLGRPEGEANAGFGECESPETAS